MPSAPEPFGTTPLDVIRLLRSGSGGLLQVPLLARLALIEWQEERQRLLHMLGVGLIGFACLLAVLLFAGGLLLAAAWDTGYRLPTLAGLVLAYGAGLVLAWRRLQAIAALGEQSFAGLREELASDAAVLKGLPVTVQASASLPEQRRALREQLGALRLAQQQLDTAGGTRDGYPRSITMRWLIQKPELVTRLVARVAGGRVAAAVPAVLLLALLPRSDVG